MAVSPAPVRPAAASGDDTKPTALAKSKPDVRAAKSKAESPKVETKAEPKATAAAAAAAAAAARQPLHEGLHVELCGREEGFFGSWYEAEVLQIEGEQAFVAMLELFEEDSADEGGGADSAEPPPPSRRLKEWWPLARLRPLPPPAADGFAATLSKGWKANLSFEGGWWEVTVVKAPRDASSGVFKVEYELAKTVRLACPAAATRAPHHALVSLAAPPPPLAFATTRRE
jgi:hypothetical protein